MDNTEDNVKNVASATILTTARTINGVSFDGSSNIELDTVNLSGIQTIAGIKTFTDGIVSDVTGDLTGNADTVTDGVYTTGTQTITGKKTFDGNIVVKPEATVDPANNGEMTFELTSDTSLTIKVKGSDGTVRSAVITLA